MLRLRCIRMVVSDFFTINEHSGDGNHKRKLFKQHATEVYDSRGPKGSPMAEAGGAADASAKPSRACRVVQIVLAVLVAFVVPVLLLDAFVGQYGANAMVLGVLVGALGSKIGGTRRMLYLAPAVGLAAGLGALTAYDWWWVGLLAAAGVVAGARIGFGWMLPC